MGTVCVQHTGGLLQFIGCLIFLGRVNLNVDPKLCHIIGSIILQFFVVFALYSNRIHKVTRRGGNSHGTHIYAKKSLDGRYNQAQQHLVLKPPPHQSPQRSHDRVHVLFVFTAS
jgi:hypothetical protein